MIFCLIVVVCYVCVQSFVYHHANSLQGRPLYSFVDTIRETLGLQPAIRNEKTEQDIFIDELNEGNERDDLRPWRAPKVRYLNIEYRSTRDSWKERYRRDDEDTIYIYSSPSLQPPWEFTRAEDMWFFPWMWTKTKVEQLLQCIGE
jgi:hypothetical protein